MQSSWSIRPCALTLYVSGRAERKTRFAPVCCGRSFVSFCGDSKRACHTKLLQGKLMTANFSVVAHGSCLQ